MVTDEGVRYQHTAAWIVIGKAPLECPALAGPKEGKLVRELEFPNQQSGQSFSGMDLPEVIGPVGADTPESHRYLDNRIA